MNVEKGSLELFHCNKERTPFNWEFSFYFVIPHVKIKHYEESGQRLKIRPLDTRKSMSFSEKLIDEN